MKIFIKSVIITAILAFGFNPLYAGGNHSHAPKEVSKSLIKKIAKEEINRLVHANTIDKSWFNRPIHKVEKKKFNQSLEWVVTFNNKQIKESKKQNLYVFVNLSGILAGANYSGH